MESTTATILPVDSSAFKEQLTILSAPSTSKLSAVAALVLERLTLEDTAVVLSQSEQRIVCKAFKVEDPQPVVDLLSYLMQQFAYHTLKGQGVIDALTACDVTEDAAAALGSVWDEGSKAYISKMRSMPLPGANVLTNITIQPQVTMNQFEPSCVVQLTSSASPSTTVQLTQDQLYKLFCTVDEIQSHVDALTGV
eukprot:PhM_4_TR3862/c0_g1_i1/m.1761